LKDRINLISAKVVLIFNRSYKLGQIYFQITTIACFDEDGTNESRNGLSWEEPYRSPSSNPPATGRDTFH